MSKELMRAQIELRYESRERLGVENIQDLARMATVQLTGEQTPPDLIPLERHLLNCELCRDDLDYLKGTILTEDYARLDFFHEQEVNSVEKQAQEDWMWENRYSD